MTKMGKQILGMIAAIVVLVSLSIFIIYSQVSKNKKSEDSYLDLSNQSEQTDQSSKSDENNLSNVSENNSEADDSNSKDGQALQEDFTEVDIPYMGAGDRPEGMKAAFMLPEIDFVLDLDKETSKEVYSQIDKSIKQTVDIGLNSLVINPNVKDKVIYKSDNFNMLHDEDYLEYIIENAHKNNLYIYVMYEPKQKEKQQGTVQKLSINDGKDIDNIHSEVKNLVSGYNVDGIIITNYDNPVEQKSYSDYMNFGMSMGFDNFMYTKTESLVKAVSQTIRTTSPSTDIGLYTLPVWANSDVDPNGIDAKTEYQQYIDGYADTKKYIEKGYVDFIMLENADESEETSNDVVEWWDKLAEENNMPLYISHSSITSENGLSIKNSNLSKQLENTAELKSYKGSVFTSLNYLEKNKDIIPNIVGVSNEPDEDKGSSSEDIKDTSQGKNSEDSTSKTNSTSSNSIKEEKETSSVTSSKSESKTSSSSTESTSKANSNSSSNTSGETSKGADDTSSKNSTSSSNSGTDWVTTSADNTTNSKTESKTPSNSSSSSSSKSTTSKVVEESTKNELTILNLEDYEFSTDEPSVIIQGASDPEKNVYVDGQAIEQDDFGYFAYDAKLKSGKNVFEFIHKTKTVVITITRNIQIIHSVSPSKAISVEGKTKLTVHVMAYDNSEVSATLNGNTIALKKDNTQSDNDNKDSQYVKYSGEFTMPEAKSSSQNLGAISFKAVYSGTEEKQSSGDISVNAKVDQAQIEGNFVRITAEYAETFPTSVIDDESNPSYYPLPKGAIDKVVSDKLTYSAEGKTYEYYNLASGNRVYTKDVEKVDNKQYKNNVNGLTVKNDGYYTYVMIHNTSKVSYKMSASGGAVKIALINTESVCGNIPDLNMNPVFSSATWSDTTLNLSLISGITGVTPYYSDNDLVFKFLNPVSISGGGAVVALDPGHSTTDPGALGSRPGLDERDLNMMVTNKVADKLRDAGIRVVIVPNTGAVSLQSRVDYAANSNADVFVSIHHNTSPNTSANGTEVYYFNNQSQKLANLVSKGITSNASTVNRGDRFGYYYVTRHQMFPAILAECGFMTNPNEYNKLCQDETQDRIAQGIADGVISYLNSRHISSATGTQTAN